MKIFIARDEDGQLVAFESKPKRSDKRGKFGNWISTDRKHYGTIPTWFAPYLKWEDEPIEAKVNVKILI